MRLIGLAFILSLTLAPLAAEAQQAGKVYRIGFLFFGSLGPSRELDTFRQGLRELGYIEGQNIVIEYRFASGRAERLPELATELARLKPDVLVTPGTPASLGAKQATSTIPIVFAGVADAVGAGLIANLARPGGNITGLTSISAELGGKRLELLKEVAPKASRVAVLYNPADRSNVLVLKELQKSAPALGLTLQPLEVRGPGEFEGAFVAMTRERAHAMFAPAGALTSWTSLPSGGYRRYGGSGNLLRLVASCPMRWTFTTRFEALPSTWTRSSKEPSQATCPWSNRRSTNW